MTGAQPGEAFEVPDFGVVLTRHRLLKRDHANPAVLILTAPAGYGKSVLAAQIAARVASTGSVWIDAASVYADRDSLLRVMALALEARGAMSSDERVPEATVSRTGTWSDTVKSVPAQGQDGVCAVLDDLKAPDVDALLQVAESLRRVAGAASLLVVTTRDPVSALGCPRVCVLASDCLELTAEEAGELLQLYSNVDWTQRERELLISASGSWPALLAVLARNSRFSSVERVISGSVPPDVHLQLRRVAEQQLEHDDIRILCAMCLLGHATYSQLMEVAGEVPQAAPERIASVVPLVHLDRRAPGLHEFRVHDLAIAAFSEVAFTNVHAPEFQQMVVAACEVLDSAERAEDLLELALEHLDEAAVAVWTLKRGTDVLASGGLRLLQSVLERLSPSSLLESPALLLLYAKLLRETSAYTEALRKAAVARDIARFQGNDTDLGQALLMIARMQIDLGRMGDAAASLEEALTAPGIDLPTESQVLAEAYLGLALSFTGNWRSAERHSRAARRLMDVTPLSADVTATAMTSLAAVIGVIQGRWDEVHQACLTLRAEGAMSLPILLQCQGNFGSVLAELGRLPRAESILHTVLLRCSEHGLSTLESSFTDSMAFVQAGLGRYACADEMAATAVDGFEKLGDTVEVARVLTYQAAWTRASGNGVRGLEIAETALENASTLGCSWLTWAATLEVAACICSLGDGSAARRHAECVRAAASQVGAMRHLLTADMILAEISRREGRPKEGIARLSEHEHYIPSDSANWQIAMYVRAFPHLLGMLTAALGADKLPVHLLQMVLPQDAERTLAACAECVDCENWRRLATRILGEVDAAHLERVRSTPQCYVRFFGGFEVRVGEREVLDRHWRKRKARLMFAMLAANCGTEIPREQLFERLWPEMDEARARNNFYVIWGAMKGALAPNAGKNTRCPYAENAGGVCRVVRNLVTSDIEEFNSAVTEAAEAERQGNAARAIRAYEQVADVYRGEFLPGDVYEDSFSSMRDTFRVEFVEAMKRASELLDFEGDKMRALLMLRRALKADPTREDLYQAAIALQIALRQRSAAIETYSACRKRLADDLGLDPSAETIRLYEQVLAMEDRAEGEWTSDPEGSANG